MSTHQIEGLEIDPSLVKLRRGTSSRVNIPVANNTGHDIVIPGCKVLGALHHYQSIVQENQQDQDELSVHKENERVTSSENNDGDDITSTMDLSELTKHQQAIVRRMLREKKRCICQRRHRRRVHRRFADEDSFERRHPC